MRLSLQSSLYDTYIDSLTDSLIIPGGAERTTAASAIAAGVPPTAVGPVPRLRSPAAHAVRAYRGGGHPRGGRPRQDVKCVRAPLAAEGPTATSAAPATRAATAAGRARVPSAATAPSAPAGATRTSRPPQERGAAMIAPPRDLYRH